MKKFKLKIHIIIFTVLSVIIISAYIIVSHKVDTNLDYCKELARNLGWLDMNQFNCSYIESDEEQAIRIYFDLKNPNKYSKENKNKYSKVVYDIAVVKNEISLYLKEHPNNELNKKKIICIFRELADDQRFMYNYDYRLESSLQKPDGLVYFKWVTVDITDADDFKDACDIRLAINNKNELQLLKEWKNLKYLELVGMEFSEEDKKYLVEILPNCTIYCNDELISN